MEWPGHTAQFGILGFVVNPKLARLCLAFWDGTNDVSISGVALERIGRGYYGKDDEASEITGLPRSHTPDGVEPEGVGYGTALYTALVLGARAQNAGDLRVRTGGYEGDGICSKEGSRSRDAERWWSRAKGRGVAFLQEDEYEDRRDLSEYVEDISSCLSGFDGTVDNVRSLDADVTFTRTADAYLYSSARKHNLVAAYMPVGLPREVVARAPYALEDAWKHVDEVGEEQGPEVILAADVRGARPEVARLLMAGARALGASEEELGDLWFRWEHGLDPSVPVKQLRLPFKANGPEARRAREILAKTEFLREETGWSDLADLP